MGYKSFEDMPVWIKSMDLAVSVFNLTEKLPRKEDFSLTSQIRRSSLSVSGNIAEGFGRKHTKNKLNFYYDARGSLCETKNHLIYGHRVKYFSESDFRENNFAIEEVWKELNLLIATLESNCRIKLKT
ncbi:MAG: four helix bundle protein [Candidatus Omnitrophota bacterium]